MSGQVNGIKETIYQIFDIVFPADLGNVSLGMNEYQELAESFRKLVDVAVEENEMDLNIHFGGKISDLGNEISELNAQIIEKDAQLQVSSGKLQAVFNDYEQSLKDIRRLEYDLEEITGKIDTLEQQNRSLEQQADEISQNEAAKENQIYHFQEQIKAKDEQIAKLTEEINKPKANIVIPSQGKSTNLQQLMEEAKNKAVKSQMDLALSGQSFRGKVELAIPPSYNGGNDDSESLFQEGTKTFVEDSGVPVAEVPSVEEVTPSQEEEITGLDEHPIVPEDNGPATWEGLKELEGRIEARLSRLELAAGIAV